MQRFTLRFVAIFSLVFMAQFAHAQMTITEYFDVKDEFTLDLKAPKNVKTIFTKGVLDVRYNADKRVLEIAYDPRQADIAFVVKNINSCVKEPILSASNGKANAK
jgi:hypothetical protein